MAIDEHFQRGHEPIGLVTADGFPWPRLITGMVAVAISMTLGWRAEQPPEPASAPATQPATLLAAATYSAEQPAPDAAPAADTSSLPPVSMLVARTPEPLVARNPEPLPSDPPQRHQLQRRVSRAKVSSDVVADRKAARARPGSASPSQVARARSARSRAEVRNEYIAAREQVAALTGEDSGSDYLARMAARQQPARTVLAGQAHHKGQAGRRAPTPS
jgi:hypothetical protein